MPNPHNEKTNPFDWAEYQYRHCQDTSGDFDAYMNHMLQKQNELQGKKK